MKQVSIGLLLLALIFGTAIQPASVFARQGSDDDSQTESSYDDDEDDDEDDDSNEDDSNDDDDSNEDDDDSSSDDGLEVEVDVFTDITIVKVELASGTKKVFDTEATTSADIVAEVAERYNLDADDVEAVLDLEIEDRASRAADRAIAYNSADCDDDNSNVSGPKGSSNDAELRARIAELQRMLETLIRLFTLRFGNLQ